jgi:hypothetical protein
MTFTVKTHCPYGHEYTPENTKFRKNKKKNKVYKRCVACENNRNAERRQSRNDLKKPVELKIVKKPVSEKDSSETTKVIEKLKRTPERTREELELLMNPPDLSIFAKEDQEIVMRGRTGQQINWGLLGKNYPAHRKYFTAIRQAIRNSKVAPTSDFDYIPEHFLEFILEVGLPETEMVHPTIQMDDRDKGYIRGNLVWKEKDEKIPLYKKKKEDRDYIEFNDLRFYETVVNGEKDYAFSLNKMERIAFFGDEGSGFKKEYLRRYVWNYYFGERTNDSRIIEYIDPNGDLTDPFNLTIKATIPTHKKKDRLTAVRQASADIMLGYIKVCLGCGAEWREIGGKVLVIRDGEQGTFGQCEQKHLNMLRMEKWESRVQVLRAGYEIPHVPLIDHSQEDSYLNRGDTSYLPVMPFFS